MKKLFATTVLIVNWAACLAQVPTPACRHTPYTIEAKTTDGAITVTLPPSLLSDGSKPPTVQAAAQHSRTMYAAMGPSVVREILDSYTCRIFEAIDKDTNKSADQKVAIKEAWSNGANDLITSAAIYFGAVLADFSQFPALNPTALQQTLDADARAPVEYLSALKDENFLTSNSYSIWITANYKEGSATACGTYVRAALAANAGNIQHTAAAVLPIVRAYFDKSKNGPRNAKVLLYGEAPSVLQAIPPATASAQADLKRCVALP